MSIHNSTSARPPVPPSGLPPSPLHACHGPLAPAPASGAWMAPASTSARSAAAAGLAPSASSSPPCGTACWSFAAVPVTPRGDLISPRKESSCPSGGSVRTAVIGSPRFLQRLPPITATGTPAASVQKADGRLLSCTLPPYRVSRHRNYGNFHSFSGVHFPLDCRVGLASPRAGVPGAERERRGVCPLPDPTRPP